MIRRSKLSFLGQMSVIAVAIGFLFFAPLQQAFGSAWTGNLGYRYGYFSNTNTFTRGVLDPGICDGGQVRGYVLPVLSNCYALPVDTINSAASFIGLLQNYNVNGDLREKTGSAFIVQTMLGRSGSEANANGGITISAADWATLSTNLTNLDAAGEIDWNSSARASTNVYMRAPGNGGSYDPARDSEGQVGPAIVFKNYSGVPVFALFRECANPDGDLSGPIPSLNYGLTPAVNTDRAQGSVVSPGDSIMVMPTVTNNGTTPSPSSDWQLSQLVVPGGSSYPTGVQTSDQPPQGFYKSLMKSGSNLASGNQVFPPSLLPTDVAWGPQTIPMNSPGGSKICYVLSVHPYQPGSNQWKHSDPYCFVIGAKPSVQIWGGDLRVGSPFNGGSPLSASVQTSLTNSSTKTYGSWTEYGILAPSKVVGMASLSGLSGGSTSSLQTNWSKLTFANVKTDSCGSGFGCYDNARSMGTIPDIEGQFFGAGSPVSSLGAGSTSIDALDQSAGVHVYTHGGDLTITGGTVQMRQSYVIRATGTVTISGDIQYTSDTLTKLTDIPQLVIIAQNIKIADTVTRIDAWLIAEGDKTGSNGILDTCGVIGGAVNNDNTTKLTTAICNAQLTVNGPVMAQKLWLRRTGGDGNTPAEILNLRADAYLWAFTQAKSGGKAVTTYTKELPPLF